MTTSQKHFQTPYLLFSCDYSSDILFTPVIPCYSITSQLCGPFLWSVWIPCWWLVSKWLTLSLKFCTLTVLSFHLKNISKLRPMLSMSNAEILINAFMTSRLDYWNALLGGCSARLINKLQMVQNAAARVLTRTRKYDHISPVLSTLHWLPIKHRIDFKILLITYKALNGLAPQYLSELLSHYSPPRPLRSQNSGHLIIPRISKSTAGGRSFSYLAPKLWNNLPNTVREADTLCQFKSRLKTHLFNLAYT